jgi:hypothetical protein
MLRASFLLPTQAELRLAAVTETRGRDRVHIAAAAVCVCFLLPDTAASCFLRRRSCGRRSRRRTAWGTWSRLGCTAWYDSAWECCSWPQRARPRPGR